MATFSLAAVLGIKPAKKEKPSSRPMSGSAKSQHRNNKTMFNFDHLKRGMQTANWADTQNPGNPSEPLTMVGEKPEDVKTHLSSQHSREHNVAVSSEAADSPVLAVKLLRTTNLSSKKIKARLSEEPESLSAFTMKYMEDHDPGWEFLDDNEQVYSARQLALRNGDINGYLASKDVATKALKKMEEPLTESEVAAIQKKVRLTVNAENPNTPDNVAARQEANSAYHQQMAMAIVARNDQIRATGVALPGDMKRADGRPVGPKNEADQVLAKLKAGVAPESLMAAR